jgi:hypothetical protein
MAGQAGFFDVDDRLKRLSDLGDQLEALPRRLTSRCSDRSWKRYWPTQTAAEADARRSIRR